MEIVTSPESEPAPTGVPVPNLVLPDPTAPCPEAIFTDPDDDETRSPLPDVITALPPVALSDAPAWSITSVPCEEPLPPRIEIP